ncbi:MAG: 50S ribosomal protein L6 [Candidatus Magasanikbacteria bacterium RIFOXYC2_FULL_42_28]|uniref:Large ribosomal subunit protein uL6 n=1 Tax=Candidatus Magasanikbacteria bacterium RIFOXYC2_FULL_42_28 TaxID=1798704 RepID=A0A1F6NU99_9BACT|nr:MAG: 50S ribosomal protein L6 [Candidatus Magasanikbacteria bacterium RIFOXYC2_FULL_42_28]
MSRVGKKIRTIPAGVIVTVEKGQLKVAGPKGELKLKLHPHITVVATDGQVTVTVANVDDSKDRALWGTFSSLIGNMITGVTVGFKKNLNISGVGFKAAMKGADLSLEVGFSHPVEVKAVPGIKFSVEKDNISVEGFDRQLVGELAARIRSIRKVEPYKGKGIKYVGEIVRRKAGKTAAKAAA